MRKNVFCKRYNLLLTKRLEHLWHRACGQISCQTKTIFSKLLTLIPTSIPDSFRKKTSHFSRERKLPFSKLIVFILSISCNGKHKGIDGKLGEFFKHASLNGLWPDATTIHRSAITKARKKIPWKIFENIFHDAVSIAYEIWPDDPIYTWHGRSVYAIDGSKHTLPATPELRKKYDPKSRFENGRSHYPKCLVSTAYDVFRQIPIARVIAPSYTSERDEALKLLHHVPAEGIIIFDRGYPGFGFIRQLMLDYAGHFLIRCPATNTFPAIEEFIQSDKDDEILLLKPTRDFLNGNRNLKNSPDLKAIKVRCIKLVSPDGTVSVLLTDMYNSKEYSKTEITNLYYKRWEAEVRYRDEKQSCEIETFHSRSENGILQEFFAMLILCVISRLVMAQCGVSETDKCYVAPQFKNCIISVANTAAMLVPQNSQQAAIIFEKLLVEIAKVRYYRPKIPKPPQIRVCKRPVNKWILGRKNKVIYAGTA